MAPTINTAQRSGGRRLRFCSSRIRRRSVRLRSSPEGLIHADLFPRALRLDLADCIPERARESDADLRSRSHRAPFPVDHFGGVITGQLLNVAAFGLRQCLGDAEHIDQGIGFLFGIALGGTKAGPDVRKHEGNQHRVGSANHANVGGGDIVMSAARTGPPDPLQQVKKQHAAGDASDDDHSIGEISLHSPDPMGRSVERGLTAAQ